MFTNFFSYKGRMGRKKYLLTFLTVFILSFCLLIGIGLGGMAILEHFFKIPFSDKVLILVALPGAIVMWAAFSFPIIKRLHDMEFSGRFFLLILIHPVYTLFRKAYLSDLRIVEAELLISVISIRHVIDSFLQERNQRTQ